MANLLWDGCWEDVYPASKGMQSKESNSWPPFQKTAVHIEVAHTLDTDSFICALNRFTSRRGSPKLIQSDNGTNFKGADKELGEAITGWNQKKISTHLHQRHIQWMYNPPGTSHMGGVWERLIKSPRQILRALLHEQTVSDETLLTMMTEVEKILNDRPLTAISNDPKDLNPLTPNHILLLRNNPCLPLGLFDKSDSYPVRRWRKSQYLATIFWRRWLREYLPTLQIRQKWYKPRRNFQTGDLVLVISKNESRGQWPLARVIEVFSDKKGFVWSVKVRTAVGCLSRPVTSLCLLEAASPMEQATREECQVSSQSSSLESPLGSKCAESGPAKPSAETVRPRPLRGNRGKLPVYLADYHLPWSLGGVMCSLCSFS